MIKKNWDGQGGQNFANQESLPKGRRNEGMIVQIYEIQRPEEAERCIELGVDHVGSVVLSETDWRRPELKETLKVSDRTLAKSSLISLFNDLETIYKVLDFYRPDFIHFCQRLTDKGGRGIDLGPHLSLQSKIKENFPTVGIIRTIPIPPAGSTQKLPALQMAEILEPLSDFFLADTWLGKKPVKGFIGITGRTCNWRVARDLVLQSSIPVLLGGGLSPENVHDALLAVRPAGADSCTKTNELNRDGKRIRFKKDFGRVKRFVEEVRKLDGSWAPK